MKSIREYFEPVVSLQEAALPHWTMGAWGRDEATGGYSEWHRDDGHTAVIAEGGSDIFTIRLALARADAFTPRRRWVAWKRGAVVGINTALRAVIRWRLRRMGLSA